MRDSWIRTFEPSPQARVRLYCFPYAGGSAAAYYDWSKQLTPEIEVGAIQLPGRADRLREKPTAAMPVLVDQLLPAISPHLEGRFAFFGHSLGAMIAFELACRLQAQGLPQPEHLFVSGRRAPQHSDRYPITHDLPKNQFLQLLRGVFSIPPEIAANEELLELVLPALRADLSAAETYQFSERAPLSCPVTAFAGSQDPSFAAGEANGWSERTSGRFQLHIVGGDHFFLRSSSASLLNVIRGQLLWDGRTAAAG